MKADLVEKPQTALQPVNSDVALSPMQALQMQIVREGDIEKMKQLMELEKQWREDQARQSFNAAFAAFKAEAVKLLRTKEVKDGPLKGKFHVELGEIVRVATPALSKHGLSISWKLSKDAPDWMEITCTLRHIDGHSETVSMGAAPDSGPGRNAIQARGSTKTYLERYTSTAILGLAPEEDDDGAGGKPLLSEKDEAMLQEWEDSLRQCDDMERLKRLFADAYKFAKTVGEDQRKHIQSVYEEAKRKLL